MFLTTLLLLTSLTFAAPTKDVVLDCVDGDTIKTQNLGKVRILGIDTYDSRNTKMIQKQMKQNNLSKQEVINLAKQGTKFCEEILEGREVILKSDHSDKDVFNRNLRYVYIGDEDYSELILKTNLAKPYCKDKKIVKYKDYGCEKVI